MPRTPNRRQTRRETRRTRFEDCVDDDNSSNGGLLALEMRMNRLEEQLSQNKLEMNGLLQNFMGEIRSFFNNNNNNNSNNNQNLNNNSNINNSNNNDSRNIESIPNNSSGIVNPNIPTNLIESVSSSSVGTSLAFAKPAKYDGSQTWESYSRQFETIARLHNWSDAVKASILVSCLRDKAREIIDNLRVEDLRNFDVLSKCLENRFGEAQFSRAYFSRFQARKQNENESLTDFSNDLDKLVKYAYPGISGEQRERMAGLQFIAGLNNPKLQYSLRSERLEFLHLATQRAVELESINKICFDDNKDKICNDDNNNSDSDIENIKSFHNQNSFHGFRCWVCGMEGHSKKNCKILQAVKASLTESN